MHLNTTRTLATCGGFLLFDFWELSGRFLPSAQGSIPHVILPSSINPPALRDVLFFLTQASPDKASTRFVSSSNLKPSALATTEGF